MSDDRASLPEEASSLCGWANDSFPVLPGPLLPIYSPMPLFSKARTVVGLDIGSSAVKAVELKQLGKGYKVTAFASEVVPPDAIVDGAIIDAGAVSDAIRRMFDGNKAFKSKEVCASLSGARKRMTVQ